MNQFLSYVDRILKYTAPQGCRLRSEVMSMGAEMTATMIVWPKRCGHGGMVLELVEHFRPYWLGRRAGHRVSATVPEVGQVLCTGLSLARPTPSGASAWRGLAGWSGRQVTVLRYAGCLINDGEIATARAAGLVIEVVDVDGGRGDRSA
jgi:hypothetical protein